MMMTILLIDNSVLQQEVFAQQLAAVMGKDVYRVMLASNEQEAQLRIQEHRPSVVFVELHLPSNNGFTVGQSIMKTTGAPCVLMSGLLRHSDISWAKKLGFLTCLFRPLAIVNLRGVLNKGFLTQSSKIEDFIQSEKM